MYVQYAMLECFSVIDSNDNRVEREREREKGGDRVLKNTTLLDDWTLALAGLIDCVVIERHRNGPKEKQCMVYAFFKKNKQTNKHILCR